MGGVFGMIGGDANADGEISGLDNVEVWSLQAGQKGYLSGDVNMDTQVTNQDKNDVWKNNLEKNQILPE